MPLRPSSCTSGFKPGYGARPVRFTVLVPLLASLGITSVPVIGLPAIVGLNVTLSWQVPPGATAEMQVPEATLYAAPVVLGAPMVRGAVPVFVTVNVVVVVLPNGRRPKPNVPAVAIVGTATPVPVTVLTTEPALLATVIVAVLMPAPDAAVGRNRTLMLQNAAPAGRVRTQAAALKVTTN